MSTCTAEHTRAIMQREREAVAKELLAWSAVEMLIRTAAARGLDKVRIIPPKPIKIRNTVAGEAARLVIEKHGFSAVFLDHRARLLDDPSDALEVSW